MKTIFTLFIPFFSIIGFAQKHYTIDAGLQLVNLSSGIVVKENGRYYSLQFNADIKDARFICNIIKTEMSAGAVYALFKDINSVSSKDMLDDYDFDKLREIKLTRNEGKNRYDLFGLTPDYLANYRYTGGKNCAIEDYLPFFSVHFNNRKTVLVTFENQKSCVIALRNKFKIVTFGEEILNYKQKSAKPDNEELYELSTRFQTEDFYSVDTLPDKKLTVKNIFGNNMFSTTYDSILIGKITQCYKSGNLDLYNQQFKKLNTEKVKAFKIHRGFIELIQENVLSVIGFDGKKKRNPPFYGYISMEENFSDSYTATIAKIGEKFRFTASISSQDTISVPMVNTEGISNFYFENNLASSNQEDNSNVRISIVNHSMDKFFNYITVYYKRKNGKYGIGHLGNFLDPTFEDENYLDEFQYAAKIEFSKGLLLVRKNNLSRYSFGENPVWYKFLGKFKGSYARYKNIDGQKGWLDRTGHEYPDD